MSYPITQTYTPRVTINIGNNSQPILIIKNKYVLDQIICADIIRKFKIYKKKRISFQLTFDFIFYSVWSCYIVISELFLFYKYIIYLSGQPKNYMTSRNMDRTKQAFDLDS